MFPLELTRECAERSGAPYTVTSTSSPGPRTKAEELLSTRIAFSGAAFEALLEALSVPALLSFYLAGRSRLRKAYALGHGHLEKTEDGQHYNQARQSKEQIRDTLHELARF